MRTPEKKRLKCTVVAKVPDNAKGGVKTVTLKQRTGYVPHEREEFDVR
jgi:hypothetical protein